jgi:outer membrane protein assembly factor BamB
MSTRCILVRFALLSLAAILLWLAPGCAGLKLSQPLKLSPDEVNHAGNPEKPEFTRTESVTPPLVREWEYDLTGGIGNGPPLIVDSVLLIGTLRGEFYALNAFTGKRFGWYGTGGAIQSSPALQGSTAIIAMTNTEYSLIAYSLVEGTLSWRRELGDLEASPLLHRKNIYIGNTEGTFRCLNALTGNQEWTFSLPGNTTRKGIRTSARARDSLIVFGAEDGWLYALDAVHGRQIWRTNTGASIFGSPCIAGNSVIVGNAGGIVTAISLASGNVSWTYNAGSPLFAEPSATAGSVFIGSTGGAMIALSIESGKVLWRTETESVINAAAVVSGDVLYFGTLSKKLHAVRIADGTTLAQVELSGRVKTPPVVANGRVFVATDEKMIISFRGATP